MRYWLKILQVLLIVVAFTNCKENKFDSSVLNITESTPPNISDTLYILQSPVWEGYNQPQDIIIGKDNFIYIADTENDRIVMLDVSGQFLGAKQVKRPVAIDQDFQLNLIVCGEVDTLINGNNATYGAVFKIDLFAVNHIIENSSLKRLLPSTSFDLLRPDRKYTGVCAFYDNSFYVGRTGPQNSNRIDPDNAVLVFRKKTNPDGSKKDTLVGKLPLFEPEGTGIPSANKVTSLTASRFPDRDMVVSLGMNSFKVQWLEYVQTSNFEGYRNKLPIGTDLNTALKFGNPQGTAFDGSNNLFVADAEKDSIYKFNLFGDELQSFGGSKLFAGKPLNSPHAVAFFDRTLYVLDTGNDRILRFILSTELD